MPEWHWEVGLAATWLHGLPWGPTRLLDAFFAYYLILRHAQKLHVPSCVPSHYPFLLNKLVYILFRQLKDDVLTLTCLSLTTTSYLLQRSI